VASEHTKRYRSYLIRCWLSVESESITASVERFVVESISDEPQRWGFNTVDDLVAFLRVELLTSEPGALQAEDGSKDEKHSPDRPALS
jgi:hypothetical protein